MSRKIFIALMLVVLLYFIESFTGGCSGSLEHPCAFRATPAPKLPFCYQYQFAAHGYASTPRRFGAGDALVKDALAVDRKGPEDYR
jgi:hypothetical protein